MKRLLIPSFARPLLAGLPLLFASCGGDAYLDDDNNVFESPGQRKPQFGYQGGGTKYAEGEDNPNGAAADPNAAPTDPATAGTAGAGQPGGMAAGGTPPGSQDPVVTPPVTPNPTTTPTPTTKPSSNVPFGIPVIGQKGYLYSPFAPEKGMVDVRDVASGAKVECPYTFKHFRVP